MVCVPAHLRQLSSDKFRALLARLYPDAFTLRCFAFEPSDNQVEEDSKSAAYLIMFPPGNNTPLESTARGASLEQYCTYR